MIKLIIHADRCKNCGLCQSVCPKKLLKTGEQINAIGYRATAQDDPEQCSGCGLCAVMCPDLVFEIVRVKEGGKQDE